MTSHPSGYPCMKHCFYNVHIDEGERDFDEDIAPSQAPSLIEENDTMSNEESLPCHIAIEDGVLKKRKVVEFRDELKRRKESTTGNKAALVERLKKALDKKVPAYPLEISKSMEKASYAKKECLTLLMVHGGRCSKVGNVSTSLLIQHLRILERQQ